MLLNTDNLAEVSDLCKVVCDISARKVVFVSTFHEQIKCQLENQVLISYIQAVKRDQAGTVRREISSQC
jgi:hypothetical protein